MSIIPLTVFCSLFLAGLFVVLFVHERRGGRFTSAERDSLLPLAEETGRLAGPASGHGPAREACTCRKGARAACPACLRRRDELDPAYF